MNDPHELSDRIVAAFQDHATVDQVYVSLHTSLPPTAETKLGGGYCYASAVKGGLPEVPADALRIAPERPGTVAVWAVWDAPEGGRLLSFGAFPPVARRASWWRRLVGWARRLLHVEVTR